MSSSPSRGWVIAIDGPDGVGKTTQLTLLATHLQQKGFTVHCTRSSGGTPIGEALRAVSLSSHLRPPETDLYISLAMGTALGDDIQPRKARGEIVLIDRSPLAVVAYNAYGSELPSKQPAFEACEQLFKLWRIDLLLFLTASQPVLDERRRARKKDDYFESRGSAYHTRVHQGYQHGLQHIEKHHSEEVTVAVIDATPDISTIHQHIIAQIDKLIS